MSFYIIYKTTNLVNGKIYIGQHHQETSGVDCYLGSGRIIRAAIKKYNKQNFIRENLEYCTSATINEREQYWICQLSATDKNIGYNMCNGGIGPSGVVISNIKKEFYQTVRGKEVAQQSSIRMKHINNQYDWTGKNNPNYYNICLVD